MKAQTKGAPMNTQTGTNNTAPFTIVCGVLLLLFGACASSRAGILLSEDFELAFPGGNGWSVGSNSGAQAWWNDVYAGFGTGGAHGGTRKGYCAGIGYVGPSASPSYQNDMSAYMAKTLDFSGYTSAALSFWYYVPSIEDYYDALRVYMDNTIIWETSTAQPAWTKITLNLDSYAGGTHTLRFEFESDYSATYEGAYLDDILVTAGPLWNIWFQSTNCDLATWLMSGTTRVSSTPLTPAGVDPSWKIVAVGDFDNDGQTDLVWESNSGRLAVWFMNGTTMVSSALLTPSQVDPSWKIVAARDIDGDGQTDLVWENDSGRLAVWFMNGTTMVNSRLLTPPQVDPSWRIVAASDFDHDALGRTELVLENNNGTLEMWFSSLTGPPTTLLVATPLSPREVNPSWKIVGTADVNGNGSPDLVWQNANGKLAFWPMTGPVAGSSALLNPSSIDPMWKVVGVK
jgi:hypothetical protein